MPTIGTVLRLAAHARHGVSWRDKQLAFLAASLDVMGAHRAKLRERIIERISRTARDGRISFAMRRHGRPLRLTLRAKNTADYVIAGEFVLGSYSLPNFEPKTIVDAGANIGTFSLHAKSRFPAADLTCYEPEQENAALLERNLLDNGFDADIRRKAVWSKDGNVRFHGLHSHEGFTDEEPGGYPIPSELPEIGADCWLKLDVEGAEYEVLPALFASGAYPRWISMEIHDYNTRGGELINLLLRHRYRVTGGENESVHCTTVSAEKPEQFPR